MRGLANKRIVIAGGANGIGLATAQRLVEEGAIAAIADIDAKALHAAVALLNDIREGAAEGFVFDLAEATSIEEMIGFFAAKAGGIHGLVNVAVGCSQFPRRSSADDTCNGPGDLGAGLPCQHDRLRAHDQSLTPSPHEKSWSDREREFDRGPWSGTVRTGLLRFEGGRPRPCATCGAQLLRSRRSGATASRLAGR